MPRPGAARGPLMTLTDFKVADLSLAPLGRKQIQLIPAGAISDED